METRRFTLLLLLAYIFLGCIDLATAARRAPPVYQRCGKNNGGVCEFIAVWEMESGPVAENRLCAIHYGTKKMSGGTACPLNHICCETIKCGKDSKGLCCESCALLKKPNPTKIPETQCPRARLGEDEKTKDDFKQPFKVNTMVAKPFDCVVFK